MCVCVGVLRNEKKSKICIVFFSFHFLKQGEKSSLCQLQDKVEEFTEPAPHIGGTLFHYIFHCLLMNRPHLLPPQPLTSQNTQKNTSLNQQQQTTD